MDFVFTTQIGALQRTGEAMIEFEWPWVFWIIPLPLLLRWMLAASSSSNDAALRVPFFNEFNSTQIPTKKEQTLWPLLIALVAWLLLVTASARPQWMGEPIELPISGRDLMMAVDLSGSMEAEDFQIKGQMVNRLIATQWVGGEFIRRRVGDRLGLILFGRQAYLQTPLTFDRETVRTLLNEDVIGLAGKETAIGDAIGLAVKRLRGKNASSRILILLTDGANTAGEVEPIKAAELAAQEGLKIYTIGIGADEMIVRSLFGNRRINPSADLDEKTLTEIAEKTGGRYFRARDIDEFEKIYKLLDELEPIEQETQTFRPSSSLYPWPLGTALAIAILLVMLRIKGKISR